MSNHLSSVNDPFADHANIGCQTFKANAGINTPFLIQSQVVVTDSFKNFTSVPFSTFQGSPVTPFSVGAGQAFSSIQLAINAAVNAGFGTFNNPTTIYIAPGSYTEDVIMHEYICLAGFNAVGTSIKGKWSFSYNGNIEIDGIFLHNDLDKCIEFTGVNNCAVTFNNCNFQSDTTFQIVTSVNPNAHFNFSNCQFLAADIESFNIVATDFFMRNCQIFGGNNQVMRFGNVSGGCIISNGLIGCKVVSENTANTTVFYACIFVSGNINSSLFTINNGGQLALAFDILVGQGIFNAVSGDNNASNTLIKVNTVLLNLGNVISGVPNIVVPGFL